MLAFESRTRNLPCRRGAIVPMVCLLLPMLIVLAAFSINFAHMELVRTQAQIASDASVRAAGRTFALTGDLNASKAMARNLAERNAIGGKPLALPDSAFTLGASTRTYTAERFNFKPMGQVAAGTKANSLRIVVDDSTQRHLFPTFSGQRTFSFNRTAISTQVEVDIVLVLDRSGSMAYASNESASGWSLPKAAPKGWNFGQFAPPQSRWLDLVNASNAFLDYLEQSFVDEQVALATYGSTASKDRALNAKYASIREGIDVYTKNFPSGATNIQDGIIKGASLLASGRVFASKVMVVMTDGIRTAGGDPVAEALKHGKEGVIIYTVTFSNEADQSTMRKVATAGSGKHFHASSPEALKEAFETIARSIPTIITQ